jgi:hypothetical protein
VARWPAAAAALARSRRRCSSRRSLSNSVSWRTWASLSERRHRILARRSVAVGRHAILVVAEHQRPHPR